jgi:hypothetical protein
MVSLGIWATGLLIFTLLMKVAIPMGKKNSAIQNMNPKIKLDF